MTGKNPGKHGIFDFLETEPGTYSQRYLNAGSRRTKTIWRMLNEAGYTVGTMNIPFTYPPEHLDGFQISGHRLPPPRQVPLFIRRSSAANWKAALEGFASMSDTSASCPPISAGIRSSTT